MKSRKIANYFVEMIKIRIELACEEYTLNTYDIKHAVLNKIDKLVTI